jgi:hypothetical protein
MRIKLTRLLTAGILCIGAAPAGNAFFQAGPGPAAVTTIEPGLIHLAQSRSEVRRERRDVREERRELRRAQRSGSARDVRRERRDVRDARRDLRDARQDRRYYVRDGRRYYRGPSGAEVFAGIVAGAIAAGAANAAVGRDANAIAYCESRFRSYDRASGTYLGYDGNRHSCP